MKSKWIQSGLIVILFLLYFLVGISVYRDYGISTDEPDEKLTTFTNIKYAMDTLGIGGLEGADGDLEHYDYRYYGVSMQVVPALIEWAREFPGEPTIWYIRHLWTFLVCFAGYVFFYLMCREVFQSKWLALLGTAMVALYPRFFAEQFYNIKDMIFVAMVMVSMFATVRVIESRYSIFWTLVFAAVAAVTTNVRIVGAVFPVLLLGFIWLTGILNRCGVKTGEECGHILRTSLIVILGYLTIYIALMPILWKNPLEGILTVFMKFSDYDSWNGTIVFMGNIIGKEDIPWYYIPVWLAVSLPVWYLVLLVAMTGFYIVVLVRKTQIHSKIDLLLFFKNKYMLWTSLIVLLPWLATVILHSTLYSAWRHFYFILPPIVFVILGGLDFAGHYFDNNKWVKRSVLAVMVAGLMVQTGWVVKNHPYEMVYLNVIGRKWGADFDRDYWNLSTIELCRYILEHDDNEVITIHMPNNICMRMLYEKEKERISVTEENPAYYIETYRGKIGNNDSMEGYEDYYSIVIDGYRIATIFKRISHE